MDTTATIPARSMLAASPPIHAAASPATTAAASRVVSMRSSGNERRSAGATADPSSAPAPVRRRTAPSFHVSPSRSWNSRRKVRKPTIPRTRPIADAARRMPAPRSSADSAAVAGAAATWVRGMRRAARVAAA